MPLATTLIAGGIKAGAGIVQSIIGYRQRKQAMDALGTLQDPQMEMPEGIREMIHLARVRAGSEMPGMDRAKDEFGARTARGVDAVSRAARTPGDIASATADLYSEEMRNVRQIEAQGAEYKAARERELMRGLETKGRYEDRMFQVNEMAPFQRKLNQYMQDAGIGGQNIAAGMGTAVSAVGDTMSNYARIKMLQGWMDSGEEDSGDPKSEWISGVMDKITQRGLTNRNFK